MKTSLRFYVAQFVWLFILIHTTESFAAEKTVKHCVIESDNLSGENLVAVTDSWYFQLALDIYHPPGPLLYVMSRKPPYHGKAFFVEFMNAACETVGFRFRADDGSQAFLTFSPPYERSLCEPCTNYSSYQKAILNWYGKANSDLESLQFGSSALVRLWGFPRNKLKFSSKLSDLESEILSASRSICRIEHGTNKGKKFEDCVDKKSGQSLVELERKHQIGEIP